MPLPANSGTKLSLNDIATEFGGKDNNVIFSNYYRGGTKVVDSDLNKNIPTSGEIQIGDFYGARAIDPFPKGKVTSIMFRRLGYAGYGLLINIDNFKAMGGDVTITWKMTRVDFKGLNHFFVESIKAPGSDGLNISIGDELSEYSTFGNDHKFTSLTDNPNRYKYRFINLEAANVGSIINDLASNGTGYDRNNRQVLTKKEFEIKNNITNTSKTIAFSWNNIPPAYENVTMGTRVTYF